MQSKLSSLEWAMEELAKQKSKLEGKLQIARKRDETSSLIEEVNAQKNALEKRIVSLQDGLKASSDLVDDHVEELETNISPIDEKLEIAKERLDTLEQEEYLEELGRKLNGGHPSLDDVDTPPVESQTDELSLSTESSDPVEVKVSLGDDEHFQQTDSATQLSPTPVLMKSSANRIEEEKTAEASSSRIRSEEISPTSGSSENQLELCSQVTASTLEECAKELGMEPEFLLNKGMQAVLRMIARNGNQVSFPLEVDQIK